MAGLNRDCLIYADGVLQDIPQEAEGIVLLNINSFAGGDPEGEKMAISALPLCKTA